MRSRSKKKKDSQPTEDLSSLWELVFAEQFLQVFGGDVGLDDGAVTDLQCVVSQGEHISRLECTFAALLGILLDREDISASDWQNVLLGVLKRRSSTWNPLKGGTKFSQLSASEKLLLLKLLINFLLEDKAEKFRTNAEEVPTSSEKKLILIGEDANSNKYWYFGEALLYREEPSKPGEQASWNKVCSSVPEWDQLLRKFQRSSDAEDKKLHEYIKDVIYPMVKPDQAGEDADESSLTKTVQAETEDKEGSSKEEQEVEEEEPVDEYTVTGEYEEAAAAMIETTDKEKKSNKTLTTKGFGSAIKTDESEDDEKVFDEDEVDQEEESSEEISREPSPIKTGGGSHEGGSDKFNLDIFSGRSKRKCVIAREQQSKKKEWWEEENILSDEEEEEEEDDSDSSDGPRKKKKKRKSFSRPPEMPIPPNRIYVFSSVLANRAAEAVLQRRCESIVAYHRSQPHSAPYLRVDRNSMNPSMLQFRQGLAGLPSNQQMLPSGYNGNMPPSSSAYGSSGFGTTQWGQYPYQQQYQKQQQDRQSSQMDDIHSFMYGNSFNNPGQISGSGMFNQQGFQQQYSTGQQRPQFNMPPHMTMPSQQQHQQQTFLKDQMREQFRTPLQQQPGSSTQQASSQPQQQFFQTQPKLHSPPPQSPSSTRSPLNTNVKSPPPPYPGQGNVEPSSTRNPVTSPGTATSPSASVGSPQTPLTPHTPRFPAIPSPGDAQRPPFSPGVQSNAPPFPSSVPPSFSTQSQQDTAAASSSGNQKFIELSKTLPLQPQHSPSYSFQQPRLPEDQVEGQETRREGFTSLNGMGQEQLAGRGELPNRSPSSSGPPNQNPFFAGSQSAAPNRNPFATPQTNVKSFSVESLTAPRELSNKFPSEISGMAQGQNLQYSYPPQTGFHYPPGKYPNPMLTQSPYLQYPPGMQHPSSQYYPSQLGPPNMYLNRNSLPTYPGGRGGGL